MNRKLLLSLENLMCNYGIMHSGFVEQNNFILIFHVFGKKTEASGSH